MQIEKIFRAALRAERFACAAPPVIAGGIAMRSECQMPGLSVPAKTRIASETRNSDPALRGYAQRPASDRRKGGNAREVDYADRTHQSLKIEGFGGFAPLRPRTNSRVLVTS